MRVGRRQFLGGAAGQIAAASLARGNPEVSNTNTGLEYGEPYELAGKRLYFTNWYYIRPGTFSWKEDGRAVGLTDRVPADAAYLTRTDQPAGIRLTAKTASRMGPLLEADRAWEEGAGVALTTIIKDGGMYRGWGGPFTTSGNPPGQNYFYYLESSNGIEWKRPNLGIVEVDGSRSNNLVNIFGTDGGSVFIDPSAPSTERYKLMAEGHFSRDICDAYRRRRPNDWDPKSERTRDGGVSGMKGATSADGLHWTMLPEPMVVEVTDTQLTAYYDERLRKYVAYMRTWPAGVRSSRVPGNARRTWGVSRRSIGRSETSNYREFPLHETILEPGLDLLPTDTLYTNGKTTMPGAPDHHLLFPTIWHTASDSTSITLASSHDGRIWQFVPGAPVFTTGLFGGFDGGAIFAHPNLLELPDGSFALPYTGYNVPHKYPRPLWKYAPGYAIWPRGRLIALEADGRGEFATVQIVPPGRRLRINALTRRGGSILVEAAGADGKPLPGRSFAEAHRVFGDQHWTPLVWGGQEDLGHPENTSILLRFRLEQAQIYGLEFV
ncbi:MAG TPA: hypothetical protein VFA33_21230 [Bryobacteraceae bacterium]|nr:hypothetical protein [Bryobacteraceae bacterium]